MPVDSRAIGWEDWKNTPKLKIRKIKIRENDKMKNYLGVFFFSS